MLKDAESFSVGSVSQDQTNRATVLILDAEVIIGFLQLGTKSSERQLSCGGLGEGDLQKVLFHQTFSSLIGPSE